MSVPFEAVETSFKYRDNGVMSTDLEAFILKCSMINMCAVPLLMGCFLSFCFFLLQWAILMAPLPRTKIK